MTWKFYAFNQDSSVSDNLREVLKVTGLSSDSASRTQRSKETGSQKDLWRLSGGWTTNLEDHELVAP